MPRYLAPTVLLVVAMGCSMAPAPPGRPNIVVLDLDTLRADHLGAYGYERGTTPNLDALAERGSVFLRTYAQAGWTAPSQTSIVTSTYKAVHHVDRMGAVVDDRIPTLAEVLKSNGYATGAFTQLLGASFRRGFDDYRWRNGVWETGPVDPWLERTVAQMHEWVSERGRPFFLLFHTYQVHLGYSPPERYARRFVPPGYEGPLPATGVSERLLAGMVEEGYDFTEADQQHVVGMYDAELAYLDRALGRFLDGLDELGLRDDTIVVVLSDHGEEFGERGSLGRHATLYNEVLRTPLILAGPGVPEGREVEMPARSIDVAPTVLDLAGVDVPAPWQGASLRSVWSGKERRPRLVFAEQDDAAVLIADRFKIFSNGHLIDLQTDPGERVNATPTWPEKAQRMRARLLRFRSRQWEKGERSIAGSVELDDRERRVLRALGYVR